MIDQRHIAKFQEENKVDAVQSRRAVKIIGEAAGCKGDGRTVAQSHEIKDGQFLTDRRSLLRILGLLGGDAVVNRVSAAITLGSFGMEMYDRGKSPPPKISYQFSNSIHEMRESPNLKDITPTSEDEATFLHYLLRFREGHHLTTAAYDNLKSMRKAAEELHAQVILDDLVASQMSRFGEVVEAKRVMEKLAQKRPELPWQQLVLVEKQLVNAFSTIRWGNALTPAAWAFESGLELAKDLGLEELGIEIKFQESQNVGVHIQNKIKLPKAGLLAGIKGFNIINSLLFYWSASNPEESRHCADIHFAVLKSYSRDGRFDRQVWKTAYMAGLHFYRLSKARDHDPALRSLAIRFFKICCGEVERGWKKIEPRLGTNFLIGDVNSLYAAIFFASDPAISAELGITTISHKEISNAVNESSPYLLQRFKDRQRYITRIPISFDAASLIYVDDNPSLEMHLPHIDDYHAALRHS